jgi:hypothetical protein
LPLAVFTFAVLSCVFDIAAGQVELEFESNVVTIVTPNSTIQVYPLVDVTQVNTCPDAAWKVGMSIQYVNQAVAGFWGYAFFMHRQLHTAYLLVR